MRRTRWVTVVAAILVLGSTACGGSPSDQVESGPSTTAPGPTAADGDPGIWPFTSRAEVDADSAAGDQAFLDPTATARQFAIRYVGMEDPVMFGFEATGPAEGRVGVGFRYGEDRRPIEEPRQTFTVRLAQLGVPGAASPWTVVGADSPSIRIDSPRPFDAISSPVTVSARLVTYENNAAVEVREDGMVARQFLGKGHIAEAVAFEAPTKRTGALVVLDRSSATGGGILSASVVRVRFAGVTESTPTPAFACNDRLTGEGSGFGTLADVRFGPYDDHDRITFEFGGAIPAYEIKAARLPLRLDPSDEPLTLEGDVFLDVVFRGASATYTFDASGRQVLVDYEGPVRVQPQFAVLREAAVRGDFEGVLIWTIGASTSTCLRVLELQSPPRLVIDLSHPPA